MTAQKKKKEEKKDNQALTPNDMPKLSLEKQKKKDSLYIVGIGASAGGLEALGIFFSHMPTETGMAFVIVSHLDPTHVSLMPELLQKQTKMEVTQVEDGMNVEANKIYIIPSQKDMAIIHGSLQLLDHVSPHGLRLPIDYFFRSLAEDQGEKAICIIFSGMGTDGSLGLKAIKEHMGMAMIQDPVSSKYDGMPRSAFETGMADYILPPEKMPEQLIKYVNQADRHGGRLPLPREENASEALKKIYILLRSHTGHDFSSYKQNTILRRIDRRMNVHQISDMSQYVAYMQRHVNEITQLFKELLIGVTNFFRDPDAFQCLKNEVFPKILQDKPGGYTVRVWVPGCSTGEEAYSVAIALRETMDTLNKNFNVQIFATDIDAESVDKARSGRYPESISADVSPECLERYFVKEDSVFTIRKNIREMLIFAPQNIIKDPPFTRLDLICCRNLLIYMNPALQKKLMPLFHYALKPGGCLFLGSSETIGEHVDLFSAVHKKWKIFERRETRYANHAVINFPTSPNKEVSPCMQAEKHQEVKMSELIGKIMLEDYAPPSVIINEKGDILYIHGRTGRYLEPSPGDAALNVFEMAREGIKGDLFAAVRKATTRKKVVTHADLTVKDNGGFRFVTVTVRPIREAKTMQGLFLVVFEDVTAHHEEEREKQKGKGSKRSQKRVEDLERELLYTRESLQTTIEELETSNEEMQSSNEELQSINEELQSTNEELETSKEELQSVNEELVTVNNELQGKNEELIKTSNDMKNLLDSINIPSIFLDTRMCITRFTAEAKKIVNLIATDIGRPFSDIATKIQYKDMVDDARHVLKDHMVLEREVQTKDGTWYLMRVSPYRTVDNIVEGVAVTFLNIDTQKHLSDKILTLVDALEKADNLFNTVREPLIALDDEFRVIHANKSFYRMFGVTRGETEGAYIYDLGNRQWDIPKLRELLEDIIPRDHAFDDFEMEHDFPRVGRKKLLLNARMIVGERGGKEMILLAMEDIRAE
jgi:two-component system CheB/CheR fusion protein